MMNFPGGAVRSARNTASIPTPFGLMVVLI